MVESIKQPLIENWKESQNCHLSEDLPKRATTGEKECGKNEEKCVGSGEKKMKKETTPAGLEPAREIPKDALNEFKSFALTTRP